MHRRIEKLVASFEAFVRAGSTSKYKYQRDGRIDKALYRFFDYFDVDKPGDVLPQDIPEYIATQPKRRVAVELEYIKAFYNYLKQVHNMNILNPITKPRKEYWAERAKRQAQAALENPQQLNS